MSLNQQRDHSTMPRSRKTKSKPSDLSPTTIDEHPTTEKVPIPTKESVPAIRVLLGVIAVSLISIPICYILSYMKEMKNSLNVFLYSAVICISVIPVTYLLLIQHLLHVKKDLFFYVFTIFSFTAVADLLLALTISDYSSAFHFYLEQGEVYLKTAHGMFINYWDGTVHYALYLIMLYSMLTKRTETKFYRFLSLFWCGSIINSLIVLVGGAAVGRFGAHIKPSCLLNVPYMLFPVIFLFRQVNTRSNFIEQQQQQIKENTQRKIVTNSLLYRSFDVFFMVYMMLALLFSTLRVLHALKTPLTDDSIYYRYEPYISNTSGFPLVQLLTYAFYFVPYYCVAIAALACYREQPSKFAWLPDWTMVHAGAAAQAQFSYFGSSLHNPALFPDASWTPIPPQYWWITVTSNLLLAFVPQLFAFRICSGNRDRDFY